MKQGTGPGGCVLQKSGFSIQGRPSSLSPSSMWVLPTSHPPDPLGFVPALISTVIHWHHSWHTWCSQFPSVGTICSRGDSQSPNVYWRPNMNSPYSSCLFRALIPVLLICLKSKQSLNCILKRSLKNTRLQPPTSIQVHGTKGGTNKNATNQVKTQESLLHCLVGVYDAGFLFQKLRNWLSEE